MASKGKITLQSSDGEVFEVDKVVALEMQAIKYIIDDKRFDGNIPLSNVTGRILAKVIEYCKKHVEAINSDDKPSEEDLKAWDVDFMKVDQDMLFDLIMVANYLNIKNLLDLTCQIVVDKIKGKTAEEIRKIFNVKNDFNPEEEEDVRREIQWGFE